MGTKQQPWPTVLSLLTTIPGIILTLPLLELLCLLLKRQHGKYITLWMLNMFLLYLEVGLLALYLIKFFPCLGKDCGTNM